MYIEGDCCTCTRRVNAANESQDDGEGEGEGEDEDEGEGEGTAADRCPFA